MAPGLILDTGVIVAAERGKIDLARVIGESDPAIAAVTAMELLAGVEHASPAHRDMTALNVEALLAVIPVINYDIPVARAHAMLSAHTRRSGRPNGTFDLIIAATACATERTLVTTDVAAGYDTLPGLRTELINP